MTFLSTLLNASVVGSAMATDVNPHEIDLSQATVEWLERYLAEHRITYSTIPRTIPEARKFLLGERFGLSLDNVSVNDHGVTFEVSEIYATSVAKLLTAIIVNGDRRFVFSGIDGVMNQQPYSEPSPYLEVSFSPLTK